MGGGHSKPLLALLSFIIASPLAAGNGIVTINQHQTVNNASCDQAGADPWNWSGCLNIDALPFANAAQSSVPVDAFAFHVKAFHEADGTHEPKKGQFCQAICNYQWTGRPKIVSTDAERAKATSVDQWLEVVCDDATRDGKPGLPGPYHGRLHFEHYENFLEEDVGMQGQCLSGYGTWGGGPDDGKAIADLFANVSEACRAASVTIPNGLIYRPGDTDRLNWSTTKGKDQAITLLGFGAMGAVALGDRLTLPNYTRDLRWKGINFTRIWAVDQWVAQAGNSCTSGKGPTPFPGTLGNQNYNLEGANKDFYHYLRRFVQSAADHGIVVQLSVFDRHGVVNTAGINGDFSQSPYNRLKNTESDSTGRFPEPEFCATPLGEGHLLEDPELAPCVPPPGFILADANEDFHFPYLARVARETGAIGNVMYEVINEAVQGSWPNGAGEDWQIEMAEFLKQNLPVSVVRDAFNEYLTGVPGNPLGGKIPDARQGGSDSWSATNASVSSTEELHTGLRMGWLHPTNLFSAMSAWVPLAEPAAWTDLGVRATVTAGPSLVQFGLRTTSGHQLVVEVDGASNRLRLVLIGYPTFSYQPLVDVALPNAGTEKTIRLRLVRPVLWWLTGEPELTFAELYVDGDRIPETPVPLGQNWSGTFARATIATPATSASVAPQVDNFEAAYFCDVPSLCGTGAFEE